MIGLHPTDVEREPPTVETSDRLVISADLRRDLRERSAAGYPHEVCGLLLGRQLARGWRVEAITQGDNIAVDRRRDRYELDPRHYLEADRIAAGAGAEIIGVWHTHPDHPAVPSATDRQHAWEGFVYVIVPTKRKGATDPRAWLFDGERFSEIEGSAS